MTTVEEENTGDWIVTDPANGIVFVSYKPTGDTYQMSVADVRGAEPGENDVPGGHLDDYLRKRAINIAAQRRITKLEQ